jgi:predicted DNA-binding transcriptional regulator YafY
MADTDLTIVRETAQALAQMLAGKRLTLAQLVRPGGKSRTAIRRRLQALVDGLPHAHRTDAGQGTTEEFWWSWPSQEVARPEQVWALAVARALLASFAETEVGRVLTELLEGHRTRVEAEPPPQADLSRMFFASTQLLNPQGLDPDAVDLVAQAIANRMTIRFEYSRFTGKRFLFEVQPWTLLLAHNGLYVFGKCIECDGDADQMDRVRVFTLARMKVIRSGESFTYPEVKEYNPTELFKNCWGLMVPAPEADGPDAVVLRFAPGWSTYLGHQKLHHTQQAQPEVGDDGWLTVRMRLHVTYDLVHWLRGHGHEIEVVEPANLAAWVRSGEGGVGYRKWVLEPQTGS